MNFLFIWNLLDCLFLKCKFFRFVVSMLFFEEFYRNILLLFLIKMLLVIFCWDFFVVFEFVLLCFWESFWKIGCFGKSFCYFKFELLFIVMLYEYRISNIIWVLYDVDINYELCEWWV